MRSINKVILVGNLTRDPEMKDTQNGQSICTFGLATNREWMTSNGERKKSTEFHEVVAWAKLADICHKYLKKGKFVYLEGYIKRRTWDGEDGEKKHKTEIVLQDMIMLNKKGDESESYSSDDNSSEEIFVPEDNNLPEMDENMF